jgi:hypothetical protein
MTAQLHAPFSLLWTPNPFLSFIIPVVGHLAVTDSEGRAHEIITSYPFLLSKIRVTSDKPFFGKPARSLQFECIDANAWDDVIQEANELFEVKLLIC